MALASRTSPQADKPLADWMTIDWREHLRTIEVAGATVNLVDVGEGSPAVVFLHGLSGNWQNWLENIPRFAAGHRVIALDLPGFGASPLPPWEISVPNYGLLLDALIEQLGLECCVLVGNSMGGFIAAETAIAFPNRVERLVLISATGISHVRMRREPALAAARVATAAAPFLLRLRDAGLRRPEARRLSFGMIFHRPEEMRPELLWEVAAGANKPGFIPALSALIGYDFHARLTEIEVPTLIVWGRQDRVVPVRDAYEYKRLIAHARLEVFEATGHCPMLERPARFNDLLSEFIA